MIRTLIASSALALFASSAVAAPVQFTPGKWTADMNMTAMGESFSESMTDCMGDEEANMEPTDLAQEFAGGANCTASNVQQSGNTVSFQMSCPGEAMNSADITLTYTESNFTMNGDIQLDIGNGQFMPATMVVNANYVGACDLY